MLKKSLGSALLSSVNSYLEQLGIPAVGPEGSRRHSTGAMSYLPVQCGLVLLNIFGHSGCLYY